MIATSQEAYEQYIKLKILEEKNRKNNAGLNLLNAEKFKPNYFISVSLVQEVNILGSKEGIVVNTNLSLGGYGYHRDMHPEDFFEQLKAFVQVPKYKFFIQYNRKRDNKLGWYELPEFRKENLVLDEIKITIGDRAKQELEKLGFNFLERVKFFLSQQKEPTARQQKDFERYQALVYKVYDLKRQYGHKSSNYYGYGQEVDSTIKISLDDVSYNEKLKETEDELKKLCKKYSFLKMPRVEYVKIVEPVNIKDWREEHEEELKESWENLDDETKSENYEGDFERYVDECFNNWEEDSEE